MGATLNKVFLIGNLTRDPEMRYITSGQAVVNFSIGVNRTFLTQSGEKKNEVSFVRIVVWGKAGENCNQYLKKGSQVFVEGRLQSRSWEANDGSKRNTMEVVAINVQFLGRAGSRDDGGASISLPHDTDNEIGISEEEKFENSDLILEDKPPF